MYQVLITDNGVAAALNAMHTALSDSRAMFEDMGTRLAVNIDYRFDSKVAPGGNPWKQWSDITRGERAEETSRTGQTYSLLEHYGDLRNSLNFWADDSSVTVGFTAEYAPELEFGARERNLPSRPMLFVDAGASLSDSDLADIMEIAHQHFARATQSTGWASI